MTNAFRETEERLRRIVEGAQDIIYDCDAMGNFTYVNPASAQMLQYRQEELLGRHFLTLIREDYREKAGGFYSKQLLDRTLNTYFEFPAVAKDRRTIWIGQHVQLVYEGQRIAGFQAIARDITRQKDAEEQLRHAQKIDAVGQLAAGIAHNFNNLLTAILGYAELTLAKPGLDEEARDNVEEMQKMAQRASALTRQLLAFARKHPHAAEDVDVNQVATDATALLSGLLREDVQVICDLAPDRALIRVDPIEMEQLLVNLALNARDALPGGGRIWIEIRRVHESPAAGAPADDYVRLRVTDNGVGMPPEVRDRVFEPFFTTKEQGQGTGLGLSFVHGIITQNQGFIAVDSAPGQGSTFTMHFPALTRSVVPPKAAPPIEKRDPAHAAKTILLVEDEDGVRTIATRLLNREGFRVLAAARPSEACALFDEHRSEIDLLLTDVVMPEMNGPSLARRLLATRSTLPILFMSGYSDVDPAQLSSQPNTGFLPKPFTASALSSAVHEMLQRRTGV